MQLKYTKKKERIVTERKRRIDLERESVGTKAWLSVAKNFEILEVNPYYVPHVNEICKLEMSCVEIIFYVNWVGESHQEGIIHSSAT